MCSALPVFQSADNFVLYGSPQINIGRVVSAHLDDQVFIFFRIFLGVPKRFGGYHVGFKKQVGQIIGGVVSAGFTPPIVIVWVFWPRASENLGASAIGLKKESSFSSIEVLKRPPIFRPFQEILDNRHYRNATKVELL